LVLLLQAFLHAALGAYVLASTAFVITALSMLPSRSAHRSVNIECLKLLQGGGMSRGCGDNGSEVLEVIDDKHLYRISLTVADAAVTSGRSASGRLCRSSEGVVAQAG
jgi:hypothetical protein